MSTSASSEAHSSIDLSELLSFNVSFKNLEFVLRTVLSRLDNVEHTVADNHDICADRDRELSEALDDAKRQLEEQKDIQAALSERCNELARQVAAADAVAKQAQERADDAHRRIDALGAAKAPTTPPAAAPIVSPVVAAAAGKNYDDDIAALQRAVNHLTETKADKKIEDDVRAVEEGLRDAEEKLASLQEACEANDASSKQRDDDLGKRIDALSAAAAAIPAAGSSAPQRSPSLVPTNTSNEWIAPLSKLTNTVDRIKADQDALSAKLAALAGLAPAAGDNNVDSGISPAQFALLQAAVNELEKRPLSKDYDQAIELLNQQVRALGNECSANAAEAQRLDDMKANKADLDALTKAVAAAAAAGSKKATSPVAASSAPPPSALERSTTSSQNNDSWVKPVADTNRRIDDLQKQLGALEGLVRGIDIHRVERNVTGLGDDVDRLRASVDELRKNGGSSTASTNDPNNRSVSKGGDDALTQAMQQQLNDIVADTAKNIDWTKGQILEIRATIEHIHHTKADTALVANKAERDFVENSMEKLMREVEQVLNATNAGLIDTLDKSLNILRDMIDGKATKQDVVKLQTLINEGDQLGGGGNVPEGLTGFKSYRCLGCNRTMDGMRQRPMGANFSTFMNRLPPNSSSSASRPGTTNPPTNTQARVAVAGPSPPAGYIGNTPQSR